MPKQTKETSRGKRGSAGYPAIETLIDTEDFNEINAVFADAYQKLSDIAGKKKGLKKSRDAKKAMTAIELTMELFRELLSIKYQLKEHLASQPSAVNAPAKSK